MDGKVVTISAAALNKTKISISGDGYTLALGSDVDAPTTKKSWSLSGSTATLKQMTSDKYSLASNAKSITHSAKATTTLATVKGVKSLEGLSANGNVVKLKAGTLNKEVTVSGGGCEFDFAAGNYNGAVVNASSNNDVITSRGKNLSVINSKGAEKIYKPTDYWFTADTPDAAAELSSFVENYSEAYPLAEFETPTPLTQKNILLTATQSNKRPVSFQERFF